MTECSARHAEVNRDGDRIHTVTQWQYEPLPVGAYVGQCLSCSQTVKGYGDGPVGMESSMALAGFGWD